MEYRGSRIEAQGTVNLLLSGTVRVMLIPCDVINHGTDKPWSVQSERYPIRGRLAEKQRPAQALLCISRYSRTIILYYLWYVRVLSIKPCLHTQLSEHIWSYWKVSRGWGHLITIPIMGHLNSFSASGEGNLNKNFPKIQMLGGLLGGMFKLRFDWYITLSNTRRFYSSKGNPWEWKG